MRSATNCIIPLLLLVTTISTNAQLDDCDFNCGTFTEKTPASYSLYEASLASFHGKIYALGATDFIWGTVMDVWRIIPYDTLYVYDPASDSWDTNLTPIPLPRYCEGENMVIDGKWYFPGGYYYLSTAGEKYFHPAPLSRFDVYDPAHDRWELKTSLPFPLNGRGAVVDGKIYLAGGIKEEISPHECLFIYDPSTDLWTQKSSMNMVRHDHFVVAAGGKIYAIGGAFAYGDDAEDMNFTGEVYDPATDKWTFISVPPDTMGIEMCAYEVIDDEIYVFGGFIQMAPEYVATRNIFKYVPRSDQWIYLGQLQEALVAHASLAIDRAVYILGGWKTPRLPGDVPIQNLTELKLGDITLDSLPRLQRIVTGDTETIDLSAYFRHIQGKAMSYRICMDPEFEDELSIAIEGESLKLTAGGAGFAGLRVLAEEGEHRMGFDLKIDVVTGTGPLQPARDPELHVYPNPAKESTTIVFDMAAPDRVQLAVLDVTGKEIATLVDEFRLAGKQQVTWNTSEVPPGIYICKLSGLVNRSFTKIIVE